MNKVIQSFQRKMLTASLFFFPINGLLAQETCSRVATVNFQEVLIDTNSNQKGEGLRYYLEKDEIAKTYLDRYQEGNIKRWQNAALGTVGTGLIVAGIFTNSDSSSGNKKTLLISGGALILINFLVAKTFEHSNEDTLQKAIEEYNKRNLPRINYDRQNKHQNPQSEGFLLLNKSWSF